MDNYDTLIEAIQSLRKEGYTKDFNLKEDRLECSEEDIEMFHNEFQIDRYFRFEGMTDPADETILYAISSPAYSLKGLLVNGYGLYGDSMTNEMTQKLNMAGK